MLEVWVHPASAAKVVGTHDLPAVLLELDPEEFSARTVRRSPSPRQLVMASTRPQSPQHLRPRWATPRPDLCLDALLPCGSYADEGKGYGSEPKLLR